MFCDRNRWMRRARSTTERPKLPKDTSIEEATLEMALPLLAARALAGPSLKKKRPVKKAAGGGAKKKKATKKKVAEQAEE